MVLAACIVLRGCAKGLLRWGLHVIPLLYPLWGRFKKHKSKKPVFGVGRACKWGYCLYSGPRSVHRPPWVRERATPLGTSYDSSALPTLGSFQEKQLQKARIRRWFPLLLCCCSLEEFTMPLCSTHFGVVSRNTNPKSPYSALVVHASGATACIVVLAACIVLRGCAKGLLRWGLHMIPLLYPLWGRFRKNNFKKPVFGVGSLCFFVVAL